MGLIAEFLRVMQPSHAGSPKSSVPSQSAPSSNQPLIVCQVKLPAQNPPGVPSVQYLESNEHDLKAPLDFAFWRHRHDVLRPRILRSLRLSSVSMGTIGRFIDCGKGAWIVRHRENCHAVRIQSGKCRNRHCTSCSGEKSMTIRHNIEVMATKAGSQLSLLTLTLKHVHAPLRGQIEKLVRCFRELRRLSRWKDSVSAAVWVLEVKIGIDGLWHPHIHILMKAPYIEQGWIAGAWKTLTIDSTNVDIRRISCQHGAAYIAKYVGKPAPIHRMNDEQLLEYVEALKGIRMCAAVGDWRKMPLAKGEADDKLLDQQLSNAPGDWISIGPYDAVVELAAKGDVFAIETLKLLGFGLPKYDTS